MNPFYEAAAEHILRSPRMSCGLRPGIQVGRRQRQRQVEDLNNAVKNTRSEDERFGGTSGAKNHRWLAWETGMPRAQ